MVVSNWQLNEPIDALIFDCDGTLSTIEGIDELAKKNLVGDIVQRMTQEAMGKRGMTQDIYAERLDLVKPTESQAIALGQEYFHHRVPHLDDVIQILKRFNKSIYIVSAGLFPSVAEFGKHLSIPKDHIFAVHIKFDTSGHYLDFDHTSPMTKKNGKREIVSQLQLKHPRIAFVGDGLSDFEVYDLVTRFIGYGGAFYRKNIEEACEFYIKTLSMAPLVPLVLTKEEMGRITEEERRIFTTKS